jgi:D-alanyl-D-alanine carboxypeptidase
MTAINEIHRALGIPDSYANDSGIPTYAEPADLVSIGADIFGRPQQLNQKAADQWQAMQLAASKDDINLLVVSAFRSIVYQATLIIKKLENGQSIEDILRVNTAPGHSEHHTGSALDLATLNCKPLCDAFEETHAFKWLTQHAHEFGFVMTYPKQNAWGIDYEPWHWCYQDNGNVSA